MGLSSSSLLDENKSNFVKGRAQAELKNFAPFYRKQYTLAVLSSVHEELVQRKEEHTQLLKQRPPSEEAKVIYEDLVVYFDDNRKWKERYAVVRANYSLECHENYEMFVKGTTPLFKLLPTGGTVLTTEETYMEMVEKCFPDTNNNVKEDFVPPEAGMPGQFPVYLRLPYRRDYYFCFYDEEKQVDFISALSNCIRHQNQDFLKKKTCEVQAFKKALQLYRQEKGHYEKWDMLIGSDVRVLANLTMEELLPSLEKDLLPRLKAKRTEKKRTWFATVEAAYYLVQETLMVGMTTLKEECKEKAKKQSVLMRSDMDQIMSSRAFLENKLKAAVAEPATKYCMEQVEPHLPAVLEELMGPISLGFKEAQELSEDMMEQLCQDFQEGMGRDMLQQALIEMSNPNLQSCYEKVIGLRDHMQELQQRFSYSNCQGLEHSTMIDIQQLVENEAYTFELLLQKAEQENKNLADTMVKAKHRVLKQYDYDSSTVRKRIFQEALINITLPSIKAHLAPTFKKELPTFDQYIFADYVPFINVENVYEDILQQILEKEVSKVVNEAASMKKYNLFSESRSHFSVSSLHSTPPGSIPSSPAHNSISPAHKLPKPVSPLLGHGSGVSPAALLSRAKAVEAEETVAQQVPAQACALQAKAELTEAPAVLLACEEHELKTKEAADVKMQINGETETKFMSTVPEIHVEHIEAVEETVKTLTVDTVTSLSDPASLVDVESTLITAAETPQNLKEPIPEVVELLVNGLPAVEKDPELVDPAVTALTCETVSAESISSVLAVVSDEPVPLTEAAVTAPPAGEEETNIITVETKDDPDDEVEESQTTADVPPSDDSSWVTEDEEIVESESEQILEVTVPPNLNKLEECVIVKCKAITDAEANVEVRVTDSLAEDITATEPATVPKPSEQPQLSPSPAEAPLEFRPPDCIKEIRDLVVEVIEVEEMIQHYPDNGEI